MNNKMYVKQKQNDMGKESKVNELLINNFFKPYLDSSNSITDIKQQINGIDIKTSIGNIDLKNAITRLDGGLKTFCLELFYRNRIGKLQEGWFMNCEDSETDYYSFNYFEHTNINNDGIDKTKLKYMETINDIGSAELLIVNKNKLADFMIKYWTRDIKLQIKKLVLDNGWSIKLDNIVSVFFSSKLNEKPVNFLISKDKLIELSDIHVKLDFKDTKITILKDINSEIDILKLL